MANARAILSFLFRRHDDWCILLEAAPRTELPKFPSGRQRAANVLSAGVALK
jgi:hypothetical protein